MKMSGKTGKTSKIAAGVLFTVNLVVMVLCTLLFSFALWMISSPRTLSNAIQGFGTPSMRACRCIRDIVLAPVVRADASPKLPKHPQRCLSISKASEASSRLSRTQPPDISKLPWSCCGTNGYPSNCTISKIYPKNCNQTIPHWLSRYQTATYASLAVLHILMSSCALVRRTRRSSLKHS
ncbi:uncharacterized protein LOC113229178 [Hyposmocoma kahamanoa]|uniref:uncharacterized protein LOC113229178 n=1 Tax=Hyposmocoma kahamanoa TaxID=1477025 RepID=UPI000E6D7A71|nr:uncharacterized protein LOC113229178 [Hyposmocoma kahamanoa]